MNTLKDLNAIANIRDKNDGSSGDRIKDTTEMAKRLCTTQARILVTSLRRMCLERCRILDNVNQALIAIPKLTRKASTKET